MNERSDPDGGNRMPDSPKNGDVTDSTIDAHVGRLLEEYLESVESGDAISQDEFLSRHPEHAERLAECLQGLSFLPSDASATELPTMFGDFRILRELGRGGMGVVYEAKQLSLDRIVALKVLRFGVVDPRALERFQREAATAGSLHHTNIVPVYTTGREGDISWYSMQRIDGESLAHRIRDSYQTDPPKPVPVEEVLEIGIQASEALAYAHQRDVVHRDVKPANLIVDQDGVVWLTDFGLARRLMDVGATMTGALMGTPRYMSPEQADPTRLEIDHHSDIYSLGATLYELTTGEPPFDGSDPLAVMSMIRNEDPASPRSLRRDIPYDLETVLLKCLCKEPDRRYATATALAEDLRAIRDGRPVRARQMSLTEKATRWVTKRQRFVQPVGIAVATTVLFVLLLLNGVVAWREAATGEVRVRAGGGPYTATIRGSDSEATVTVPMEESLSLSEGDYSMQLAARGNWSQSVRFHVQAQKLHEMRVRAATQTRQEIEIEDAQAVPTAGFDGPEMLLFRGSELQRIPAGPTDAWKTDVSAVKAVVRTLGQTDSESKDASVDFTYRPKDHGYAPWTQRTLSFAPKLATPVRALAEAIDLDGDQKADSIVFAVDQPAILALDAMGEKLWCRRWQFPEPAQPFPDRWSEELVLEFVLDALDVGDLNSDGVHDLAAQIIRIQPLVQTDVTIAVICGRTGDLIRAIACDAIVTANQAPWPFLGILNVHGDDKRSSSSLLFGKYHDDIFRSLSVYHESVMYNTGNVGSAFAVPLPLLLARNERHAFALQCVDDNVALFNLETGELVAQYSNADAVHRRPKLAMHHDESRFVMVGRDRKTSSDCLSIQDLEGNCIWKKVLDGIDWIDYTGLTHAANWPVVADLDDDGSDEVIVPVDFQWEVGMSIQAHRIADGETLWPVQRQLVSPGDGWVQRMVVTSDVNHDGWRDVAVTSFAGRRRNISGSLPREQDYYVDAFVYVDWISGKTGEPLAWARYPVPKLSDKTTVAQVDGLRAGPHGQVEVELIAGDNIIERTLECTTLRFVPSSIHPTHVAKGLTVCDASASFDGVTSRWYRQRSGPFSLDPECLLLLDEPGQSVQRLGENDMIATWRSRGKNWVAVQGTKPNRLSVLQLPSMETAWSAEVEPERVLPLEVAQDRVDMMVSTQPFHDKPPTLQRLHGDTGRPVWAKARGMHGTPIHVQYLRNSSAPDGVLVVDNGVNVSLGGGSKQLEDALSLSMFQADTGRLLWREPILHDAKRSNQPRKLADFGVVDVNGDGWCDILSPDQDSMLQPKVSLGFTMWDGKTGDKLWTRCWQHEGYKSYYEPMPWTLVSSPERSLVVIIEPAESDYIDSRTQAEVVVCDAADGEELARLPTDFRFGLPHPRYIGYAIAIRGWFNESDRTVSLVAWMRDDRWKPHLAHYTLKKNHLVADEACDIDCRPGSQCWFLGSGQDGEFYGIVQADDQLKCYRPDATLRWCADLKPKGQGHRFYSWNRSGLLQQSHVHSIWNVDGTQQNIEWIDLSSGQVLRRYHHKTTIDRSPFEEHPPLAAVIAGNKELAVEASTAFLASTSDGVSSPFPVDIGRPSTRPSPVDPRRVHRLPWTSIRSSQTLSQIVLGKLRSLFVAMGLLVLPLAFCRRIAGWRQFSLTTLLLLPGLLLFSMLAYQIGMDAARHRWDYLGWELLGGLAVAGALYGMKSILLNVRRGWLYLLLLVVLGVFVVLWHYGVILTTSDDFIRFGVTDRDVAIIALAVWLYVSLGAGSILHLLRLTGIHGDRSLVARWLRAFRGR